MDEQRRGETPSDNLGDFEESYYAQAIDGDAVLIYSHRGAERILHGVFSLDGITPSQIRQLSLGLPEIPDPDPQPVQAPYGEAEARMMQQQRQLREEEEHQRQERVQSLLDACPVWDPDSEGRKAFYSRFGDLYLDLYELNVQNLTLVLSDHYGVTKQTIRNWRQKAMDMDFLDIPKGDN